MFQQSSVSLSDQCRARITVITPFQACAAGHVGFVNLR